MNNRPGNTRPGRWWWPVPPPPVPPPAVTLTSLARQMGEVSDKLDRLIQQEAADLQDEKKGRQQLMAQIDDLIADVQGLTDDLTAFKTDFDAAVAALQAQNVPANLQPAIDQLVAARQKLAGIDTQAKGLVSPAPTPAP